MCAARWPRRLRPLRLIPARARGGVHRRQTDASEVKLYYHMRSRARACNVVLPRLLRATRHSRHTRSLVSLAPSASRPAFSARATASCCSAPPPRRHPVSFTRHPLPCPPPRPPPRPPPHPPPRPRPRSPLASPLPPQAPAQRSCRPRVALLGPGRLGRWSSAERPAERRGARRERRQGERRRRRLAAGPRRPSPGARRPVGACAQHRSRQSRRGARLARRRRRRPTAVPRQRVDAAPPGTCPEPHLRTCADGRGGHASGPSAAAGEGNFGRTCASAP